ncbi:MAG: ankyrin repeat domain-containing protein [Alphaproteobacteria bacterium]|nr:ankyrin repeat domain-containing protein [Alphaproteobacteria bacterium]
MKRFFKAALRRDKKAAQMRAAWEKTNPPRALVEYSAAGDLAKVDALLVAGVDPNAEVMIDITVDTVMETPLCAAASAGHVDIARRLIAAGAQVDKPSDDGFTPLLNAATNGWPDMVKCLHEAGANLNAREDIFNHTPLHKATRLARMETVKTLMALGADQTLRDAEGKTAEETICDQCGKGAPEKAEIKIEIQKIFADDRAARAAAEKTHQDAAAAYVRALDQAGELQRDLPLVRPAQVRPRRRKP